MLFSLEKLPLYFLLLARVQTGSLSLSENAPAPCSRHMNKDEAPVKKLCQVLRTPVLSSDTQSAAFLLPKGPNSAVHKERGWWVIKEFEEKVLLLCGTNAAIFAAEIMYHHTVRIPGKRTERENTENNDFMSSFCFNT